jgi:hypothetical protein
MALRAFQNSASGEESRQSLYRTEAFSDKCSNWRSSCRGMADTKDDGFKGTYGILSFGAQQREAKVKTAASDITLTIPVRLVNSVISCIHVLFEAAVLGNVASVFVRSVERTLASRLVYRSYQFGEHRSLAKDEESGKDGGTPQRCVTDDKGPSGPWRRYSHVSLSGGGSPPPGYLPRRHYPFPECVSRADGAIGATIPSHKPGRGEAVCSRRK